MQQPQCTTALPENKEEIKPLVWWKRASGNAQCLMHRGSFALWIKTFHMPAFLVARKGLKEETQCWVSLGRGVWKWAELSNAFRWLERLRNLLAISVCRHHCVSLPHQSPWRGMGPGPLWCQRGRCTPPFWQQLPDDTHCGCLPIQVLRSLRSPRSSLFQFTKHQNIKTQRCFSRFRVCITTSFSNLLYYTMPCMLLPELIELYW